MTIALSSPEGTPIINITAHDGDQPNTQNSEITFSLVDSNLPFTLDETSGQLSTGVGLEGRQYRVEVIASDNGNIPGSLSTTGAVTIQVAPPNFHDPVFPDNLAFGIMENSAEAMYNFTITDADNGMEGMVRMTLVPSEYSNNFTIQSIDTPMGTLGRIFFNGSGFDHETINNFTLTVQATDQGITAFRRTSVATINVTILDMNDNPPMFVGDPYVVSVSETTEVDTSIARVMAMDADIGTNAVITYTLLDYESDFRVNESTGSILVNATLSTARRSLYRFDIVASDGVFAVSTLINITVTEVNDNAPMFFNFSPPLVPAGIPLPENTEVGAVILNIDVVDPDTGLSGDGILSIQQDGSTFHSGSLGRNMFYLSLNEELDFEVSNMGSVVSIL